MPPRVPMPRVAAPARTLLRPLSTSPASQAPRDRDLSHHPPPPSAHGHPPSHPRQPHPPSQGSRLAGFSRDRLSGLNRDRLPARGGSGGGGGGGGHHQRPSSASMLLDMARQRAGGYAREKAGQMEHLRNMKMSSDYLRQMPRRWEAGDVYSPHDLSPVEMQKWRRRTVRNNDVVDALGISPLDMYKNFSLIEHFTTSSGMINHSQTTRLRPVNQRKIAKMVRRVQGMGIYPTIHDHPEMLRDQFFSKR